MDTAYDIGVIKALQSYNLFNKIKSLYICHACCMERYYTLTWILQIQRITIHIQLSGGLFGHSDKGKKLSQPTLLHFLFDTYQHLSSPSKKIKGCFRNAIKLGGIVFFHFSLGQIVHQRAGYSLYLGHKNENTFYKVEVTKKYISTL